METSIENLDLSAGSYVKGLPQSETSYVAITTFAQLQQLTRNPRDLQPTAKRMGYEAAALEEEAGMHELVQRALTGNKKTNVPKYANYIHEVVMGRREGVLPPIHVWSQDALDVVRNGPNTYLLVPQGNRLLAIDGETQLTAHYEVAGRPLTPEERAAHRSHPLVLIVHHGIPTEAARQFFHDLNIYGVKPNTSLGLSMDARDPLMRVITDLEVMIPFLSGRVDKQARQLTKSSSKVITLQALRQTVINIMFGMAGVQYGAKAVSAEGVDLDDLKSFSQEWLGRYFSAFTSEFINRETHLAGSAPVLAAVGAIGNSIFGEHPDKREALIESHLADLRRINWEKGQHWEGIAGKFTPKGKFSVGGTKEVAYAVYNVLTDSSNDGYARIRTSAPQYAVN